MQILPSPMMISLILKNTGQNIDATCYSIEPIRKQPNIYTIVHVQNKNKTYICEKFRLQFN